MDSPRKKLLKEAFCLFLVKSYDSVTMMDIQKAAKTSRGAIYYHFRSKEEIYEEVIKEFLIPTFSNYSLIPDVDKRTLQEAILASIKFRQSHVNLLMEVTSYKLVDFYFFKFIFQAVEHSANFREKASILVEKEFNGWRNIIQVAIRTGEIRPDVDIDYTAKWFITAPLELGIASVFGNYINVNTNDIRTTYLRYYNLLKKPSAFM